MDYMITPATSESSFLEIWARDFVPNERMEIPEYFVYFGIEIRHSWGKRSVQIPKGEVLELRFT